jgi:hypothetical protein
MGKLAHDQRCDPRRWFGTARLGVLLFALIAAGASSVPATATSATAVPAFGHVFVIVGENKSLSQLKPTNAPYIMNTLKPASAWLTGYNAVIPGSLADYAALTSGQYASCETAGPCGKQNVPSIFSQVGAAGWHAWNESMPANCAMGNFGDESTLNAYKYGHNPALFFAGLPCASDDVPAGTTGPDDMSYFNNALAAGTVPEYNLIIPNLCEDSYRSCNGANIITEYDNFLKREIPLIEASPSFGSNGVIFITYDEGNVPTHNPNTMMDVIGPQVVPGAYPGYYDHYSTLATIEQGLGLSCLANACSADTLPVFGGGLPPAIGITQPTSGSTISGTTTVSGTSAGQDGATIAQVQVSVDNGVPQTATGTLNWSASLDTTTLANGIHTITATATDSNGLITTTSIQVTVSNGVVTSCPATPLGATEYSGNLSLETSQTGWTGLYNQNSALSLVQPAGGSYDGSWALQVGIKSGSGVGGVANAQPIWVRSTSQGTTYTASSFLRAGVAGEKVSLTLTEVTSGGATVASHTTAVTLNDTNWHSISNSYTAAGAGDILKYSLHASFADASQTFLADCLSLQSP